MALSNVSSKFYLQLSKGKVVRPVKLPTETSKSRMNKNDKLVHEEIYDQISGKIEDITIKNGEYGKSWVVKLVDDYTYFLEFNFSSGYASTFLKALPNIDFTQPVTLVPKIFVEGDKSKSVLFINQGGKGVKHYFTKDHPNELPEMVKIKVKGVETWDDTNRMEWLEKYILDVIVPKIKSVPVIDNDETPF